MGKRKRKRQQGQKRKASPKIEKKKTRLRPYMIIAVILLLAGGGVYAWWYTTQQETSSEASARESKQSSGLPATPRVPRPATLAPAEFSGKTARAYRIASNVPELIERMPCYCDCYRGNGHQNNLDCYVDKHAATWNLCQDITLDAYAMYRDGKSVEHIKEVIDAKYAKYSFY